MTTKKFCDVCGLQYHPGYRDEKLIVLVDPNHKTEEDHTVRAHKDCLREAMYQYFQLKQFKNAWRRMME